MKSSLLLVSGVLLTSCSWIPAQSPAVPGDDVMMPQDEMMEGGMMDDDAMMEDQGMPGMPYEGAEGEYEMMNDDGMMQRNDAMIHDYESCIAAGYPMMKSMPPQCATADGRVFVQGGGTMEERMMAPGTMEQKPDHGGWVDDMMQPGAYRDFVDGVIGNGMESVLFFHAAWCPYCIANDKRLTGWYSQTHFPRSVYKIDYDTATELKTLFGVTNQDTFILIDGNGNEISRVTFPSESALKDMLGTF